MANDAIAGDSDCLRLLATLSLTTMLPVLRPAAVGVKRTDITQPLLASDLKPDTTADSISDVVEQAIAFTRMRQVLSKTAPSCSAIMARATWRGV